MSTTVETRTEAQSSLHIQQPYSDSVAPINGNVNDATAQVPADAIVQSSQAAQTKQQPHSASRAAPIGDGPYPYEHLLPHFSNDNYPPLTPFEHADPGLRALAHPNPRAFLDGATRVAELTPNLGTEIDGVDLATLDDNARDQLALEVGVPQAVLLSG